MRYRLFLATIAFSFLNSVAFADQGDDAAFFQQRSQHAYNAVFGLPTVAPRLVQTIEWQVSLEHNNQFAGGSAEREQLLLDGESSRLTIRHRQRLGACWQFEASLPFVAHNGGKFDRAIDDFHKLFAFPDAFRDATDFNRLRYVFLNEDGIKHDIDGAQSGVGDIQIAVQRALGCFATADSTHADAMIRFGVKLPTGEPDELRGSGEVDLFADWQSPVWNYRGRWHGGAALGALVNGQTDRFAEQQPFVVYGSLGAQFALTHKLRLIAQLDGHSAFYRSDLRELGSPSVNLALGARYLSGRSQTYEISFSEDAAIDTTPDIVVRLAVTYRPDQTR